MNLSILYKKLTNRKHTIGYKFILSLFVYLIGFISFCNALTINGASSSFSPGTTKTTVKGYCYRINNTSYNIKFYDNNDNYLGNIGSQYNMFCNPADGYVKNEDSITTYLFTYNITNFDGNCNSQSCPECPTCDPQYTSEQCQTVYGLVSSGLLNTCENNYNNCQTDLNSCQNNTSGFNDLLNNCSNNLNACNNSLTNCLQHNCPETVTGTNRSSLFINNIQYPGAPTIKFTIPEEIERDQNTDEEETNIDVIGYGYDQDKMQQMVNTQYYKPTAEEMSGLIEKIADFLPLVAVALLIIRIRRVLKKVFKF